MTDLLTNQSEIGLRRDLGKPPPRRHTGAYHSPGVATLARVKAKRIVPLPLPRKKVELPANIKWVRR
jgi:hypothetical protein